MKGWGGRASDNGGREIEDETVVQERVGGEKRDGREREKKREREREIPHTPRQHCSSCLGAVRVHRSRAFPLEYLQACPD